MIRWCSVRQTSEATIIISLYMPCGASSVDISMGPTAPTYGRGSVRHVAAVRRDFPIDLQLAALREQSDSTFAVELKEYHSLSPRNLTQEAEVYRQRDLPPAANCGRVVGV